VVVWQPAVGAQLPKSWEPCQGGVPRARVVGRSCAHEKEDRQRRPMTRQWQWLARLAPWLSSKTSSSLYYDFSNGFNGEHDTATP
jgi:hypothetical protein